MTTEFRPIETKPQRSAWPYAAAGALVAALAMFIFHRASLPSEKVAAKPVAAATIVAQDLAKAAPIDAAKPPEAARPAESPNVIGAAAATAQKLAMVAKSELDRELGRTKAAQREAQAYRKQIADLQQQLNATRAQLAAFQQAQRPPPPSDREQILQMLAPVLKASNDGRP